MVIFHKETITHNTLFCKYNCAKNEFAQIDVFLCWILVGNDIFATDLCFVISIPRRYVRYQPESITFQKELYFYTAYQ